jgi:trans-2,3-dihydro-3-hydroxyanthranilate isomerase
VTPLRFEILNVFVCAGERLSGNPLCVIEHAEALDTPAMQALARQFNLSETTFILPSEIANARVRIFTPDFEMPFAGHPILGTAHVCRAHGLGGNELTLETQSGVIPLRARGNRWSFQALTPSWRDVHEPPAALAAMMGLSPSDIVDRPLWVKSGKEQLIIPLATVDAVERARPTAELFARVQNDEHRGMAYIFAPTGSDRMTARYFVPSGQAILEDPATGSATANLGGWWLGMKQPLPITLTISQGRQVQRPSELTLEIDAARTVRVSGAVIEFASGTLNF